MIVLIRYTKWIVQWEHYNIPDEIKNGWTNCTIKKVMSDGSLSEEYSLRTAKCSQKDQFNKNTGRKVSMKRAIQGFKQSERRKFWEAYAEMRNGNF